MPSPSVVSRVKNIQKFLGLEADGIIGSDTLTAIERIVFEDRATGVAYSLTVSRAGLDLLIEHEISSKAYYNRRLKSPVWPGGNSGVTMGIGYDLGYHTAAQVKKDWGAVVSESELKKLQKVVGLRGLSAKRVLSRLSGIKISFSEASRVFSESTLPAYAKKTRKAYPGVEKLHPDAQAALLSLVYNRGTSMSRKSSRKEMRDIRQRVVAKDYSGIAQLISGMKRLWLDKGLPGLLKRRDDEAGLVEASNRHYDSTELINV